MAIELKLLEVLQDKFYGQWVRKARPVFMGSEAQEILTASLRLYLRRETSGLSFLIAGHRGAGKTALVAEVVAAISDDLFERWQVWTEEMARWERAGNGRLRPESPVERQRPLLVKLHGPSLVAKELPSPGGGEDPKTRAHTEDLIARTTTVRRWAAGPVEVNVNTAAPAKAEADTRTTPTGEAQAALVQIMIALYRALADEVGEAAAVRALDRGRESDVREFAAQLRFDLDRAAGPETLREFWEEIEPNRCGFFWPRAISEALARHLVIDQHFREIVAVATAAQAFQVCSGAVTYSQTRKDSATQERSAEFKTGFDAKDAMNRLVTLGVGGLLGYGIAGAAGAGVGLLGSLGVTTLSRRSDKRERSEDYTFIVDRSTQTLERDLPLVIERIRAAGLAPVFMVDELDKVPLTSQDGVDDVIGQLINRLKRLTTDYGFFCFLTGRDYFNDVERRLADKTYPVEHTYFSERLLIGYGPADFDRYASAVVVAPEQPTRHGPLDPPKSEDLFVRHVLSKELVFASQLSTIDFRRQLRRLEIYHGRLGSDRRWFDESQAQAMAGESRQLIRVALQLAIGFVLERAQKAKLTLANRDFWQMSFDVLYRVARLWEDGQEEIDMAPSAIADDLLLRRNNRPPAPTRAVAAAENEIGKTDFDALCKMAEELTGYLCEFRKLFSYISGPGAADSTAALNSQIFTPLDGQNIAALLKGKLNSSSYEFRFTPDGGDRLDSREFEALGKPVRKTRAAISELAAVGVRLDDLQILGWPQALFASPVEAAIDGFSQAEASSDLMAARTEAARLDALKKNLETFRTAIDNLVGLCADIVREARLTTEPMPLSEVIASLPRHIPDSSKTLKESLDSAIAASEKLGSLQSLAIDADEHQAARSNFKWSTAVLRRARETPHGDLESRAERAWEIWRDAIERFVAKRSPRSDRERPQFDDLVLTAAGRLPSRILRHDLSQVDDFVWTEFALAAIASQWETRRGSEAAEPAPAWAAFAGFRVLGFGRKSFEILRERLPQTARTARLDSSLVPDSDAQPGTVVVVAPGRLPKRPTSPYLLVTEATMERYRLELGWLKKNGIIESGAYERE
jgi:hypothetical protein